MIQYINVKVAEPWLSKSIAIILEGLSNRVEARRLSFAIVNDRKQKDFVCSGAQKIREEFIEK